jgi:hypothetical protein
MYDCVYVSRSRSTGAYLKANEEEEVVMDSMSGGLIRQRGIFSFLYFYFYFSWLSAQGNRHKKQRRRGNTKKTKMEKSKGKREITTKKTTAPVAMDDGVESQAVLPGGGEILDADTRVLGRGALSPSQKGFTGRQ